MCQDTTTDKASEQLILEIMCLLTWFGRTGCALAALHSFLGAFSFSS